MKMTMRMLVVALMLFGAKSMWAFETSENPNNSVNAVQTSAAKNTLAANEDEEPIVIKNGDEQVHINVAKLKGPEDIVVPIAFFVFLLALFMGRRYFMEQTQQRKIALLEKMVEKGQPVSDAVIQQVFAEDRSRRYGPDSFARTVRRGVAFTVIGIGLLIYSLLMHHVGGKLVFGIVMLGLGIGNLVSHRFEKKEINSSDM
jgi:hypothetical protein